MATSLEKALQSTIGFTMENLNSSDSVKLCLFPGHFMTEKIVTGTRSGAQSATTIVAHNNKGSITDAGYTCDQMADDYDELIQSSSLDKVKITPNSKRNKYADFLNYIRLNGTKVSKIRINAINTAGKDVFNQELEISASSIAGKVGSDFITLQEYVKASDYKDNMIDVDLSERNLAIDNTTLAFLDIPAGAKISIIYTLN